MPSEREGWAQPEKLADLKSEMSQLKSGAPSREMTFGEKLVGLTFNPSGDEKVTKAKKICAELADLLFSQRQGESVSDLYENLYLHAMGEILNAQMNVVKVLTLKY